MFLRRILISCFVMALSMGTCKSMEPKEQYTVNHASLKAIDTMLTSLETSPYIKNVCAGVAVVAGYYLGRKLALDWIDNKLSPTTKNVIKYSTPIAIPALLIGLYSVYGTSQAINCLTHSCFAAAIGFAICPAELVLTKLFVKL